MGAYARQDEVEARAPATEGIGRIVTFQKCEVPNVWGLMIGIAVFGGEGALMYINMYPWQARCLGRAGGRSTYEGKAKCPKRETLNVTSRLWQSDCLDTGQVHTTMYVVQTRHGQPLTWILLAWSQNGACTRANSMQWCHVSTARNRTRSLCHLPAKGRAKGG